MMTTTDDVEFVTTTEERSSNNHPNHPRHFSSSCWSPLFHMILTVVLIFDFRASFSATSSEMRPMKVPLILTD
jgi:hypothetical protein